MNKPSKKPIFTTGIAAELTGIKPKTIINYENAGLIKTTRTRKNRRLFSKEDLLLLLMIRYLLKEKGLTFDGIKFVLTLMETLAQDGVASIKYILPDVKRKEFEQIINI